MDPADLARQRTPLTELAHNAKTPAVRAAAYAALVTSDGKPDVLWSETEKNGTARANLIESIVMLPDPDFRAKFQPLLVATLENSRTPGTVRNAALRALPLMGAENAGQNFEILARHLQEGRDLSSAARSVMELPRASWNKDKAPAVTQAIADWAKSNPCRQTDFAGIRRNRSGGNGNGRPVARGRNQPGSARACLIWGSVSLRSRPCANRCAMTLRASSSRPEAVRNHFRKHRHDAPQSRDRSARCA